MRVSRFVTPLFVLSCVIAAVAAADLTGTWRGPMDAGGEAVFHLKMDDKGVGGSMVGADGKDYPVSSGKLDGDKISMTVDSKYQDMPVKLIVTGTVAGEQMKLHIASYNGYWQTDATVKRETK